jgi:hypothetical protein
VQLCLVGRVIGRIMRIPAAVDMGQQAQTCGSQGVSVAAAHFSSRQTEHAWHAHGLCCYTICCLLARTLCHNLPLHLRLPACGLIVVCCCCLALQVLPLLS